MSTRDDIERFFRTLLLGDFEEEQSFSAQIVGGLISMIPVLDQVMDARDITGTLYRINARGGFRNADTDQLVNLGFAAFGAIPEVGSAFKTVFKPLWKERRAAKGMVHSGLNAVEGMLGMNKGGAIRWIRQELIGKWTARTNAAITAVEAALASMIELTEFIANARGWQDWMIPDSIQEMARQMLPSLKSMQGQIRSPLERASSEIRAFLEDLLGEQAAAVVMAVGDRAAMGSATPGARPRTGHNMADAKPRGKAPAREPQHKVQSNDLATATKGRGPMQGAVQLTRKTFESLENREKGLIGEHIVDYHELKRLGGSWVHDKQDAAWNPDAIKKINVDHRPVALRQSDLKKVTHTGIDAVWSHHGSFTVTEAKARTSIWSLRSSINDTHKKETINNKLTSDQKTLYYLLGKSNRTGGGKILQMSAEWVSDRALHEGLGVDAVKALHGTSYDRRVVLVTFESDGALDHAQALTDVTVGRPSAEVHPHLDHGITKAWLKHDIDAVVNAYDATMSRAETAAPPTKTEKPSKSPPKRGKPRAR
ncbi:hypothetical protein [Cupriavidus plantarum]|uniref:hypothetical protein n=1 Tax=Cupriavidus plantarum TaxID=942865 RepID=UPI000EB0FED6|nr:hypothetical protein [Cupriavidus plantarum]RLK31652.1 hypothetical protein C7417_4630 [Cupriavidus plantarum]